MPGCLTHRSDHREVPAHDLRQPGHVSHAFARGGDRTAVGRRHRGASRPRVDRVRRVARRRTASPTRSTGKTVHPVRRRAASSPTALPRDQGVPRQLLPDRLSRARSARSRSRRPSRAAEFGSGRGVAAHARVGPRRCDPGRRRPSASRTCCARWRRRSSARSCAATATSTRARTPCRRPCSAAAAQWPGDGRARPTRGRWLITVAVAPADRPAAAATAPAAGARSEVGGDAPDEPLTSRPARRRRPPADRRHAAAAVPVLPPGADPAVAVALTLRAVGGLTTAEIARAFLVPEATMAQRISRAKQRITAAGARFDLPPPSRARPSGCASCCTCSTSSSTRATPPRRAPTCTAPTSPPRPSASPATVHRLLPDDGEVAGLLALMLLTDARRPARTGADGDLRPARPSRTAAAGTAPRSPRASPWSPATLPRGPLGPYQLQAAIAAVHDEAPPPTTPTGRRSSPSTTCSTGSRPTRWSRSTGPSRSPWSTGPTAGLALLDELAPTTRMADHHRLHAVRAHLLELAGDLAAARADYRARRPPDDEPPRAALPRRPRPPPRHPRHCADAGGHTGTGQHNSRPAAGFPAARMRHAREVEPRPSRRAPGAAALQSTEGRVPPGDR